MIAQLLAFHSNHGLLCMFNIPMTTFSFSIQYGMTSVIFKIFLYKKVFCDSFHRLESSDLTLFVRFIQTVVFLVKSCKEEPSGKVTVETAGARGWG